MLTFDEVGPTLRLPLDLHRCTSKAASPGYRIHSVADALGSAKFRYLAQQSGPPPLFLSLCSFARHAIQHALSLVPAVLVQAEEHDAQELEDIAT